MAIETHLPCKFGCGSSDAMAEYEDNWYCHSCQRIEYKNQKRKARVVDAALDIVPPENLDHSLPPNAKAYLYKYHFTDTLITKYQKNFLYADDLQVWSERYSRHYSVGARLLYCYWNEEKLLFWEARRLGKAGPKYVGQGGKGVMWWCRTAPNPNVLVICEDILSCIRIGETYHAVALRGTSLNNSKLAEIVNKPYTKIVMWLDGDKPGQIASSKIREKLKWFCPTYNVLTNQDPKCYTDQEIKHYINQALGD